MLVQLDERQSQRNLRQRVFGRKLSGGLKLFDGFFESPLHDQRHATAQTQTAPDANRQKSHVTDRKIAHVARAPSPQRRRVRRGLAERGRERSRIFLCETSSLSAPLRRLDLRSRKDIDSP